jgi:dipeptidyl-peptidase 4
MYLPCVHTVTLSVLLLSYCLVASTNADDINIQRALELPTKIDNLVFRDRIRANWLPGGKSFWYQVQTGSKAFEFVLIDATTGDRKVASKREALNLPEARPIRSSDTKIDLRKSVRTGDRTLVRFVNKLDDEVKLYWINPSGEHIEYGSLKAEAERIQNTYAGHKWLLTNSTGDTLGTYEADILDSTFVIDGKGIHQSNESKSNTKKNNQSPDGKWSLSIDEGRVQLINEDSKTTTLLSTEFDGVSPFQNHFFWSPDSSAFVVCNTPMLTPRQITIVESSPKDQLQPKLRQFEYAKPGDPLPQPKVVLFRSDEREFRSHIIDEALFPTPFTTSGRFDVQWMPDSSEFYFDYNERGHQTYRIIAVDRETGRARVVVEEKSATFVDYTNKTWRHWLHETNELLWMSERSDWCHLWLYDSKTGQAKNPTTKGRWPVREVLKVDERTREIWFMANGLSQSEDPYHLHLCRAAFDGSGFIQLTQGDGNHAIQFSPDREFFIDAWSRVDQPKIHELRQSRDGKLVSVLETADISKLTASGWHLPERFSAMGRDGETAVHGIIITPTHFDPTHKYPVVEQVYAGPHSAFVPKDFGELSRQHQIAELGFIVVQVDGMGTNHRGKVFHDVCWKNLKDAGFPDRIAWIKAAAVNRPWMDLNRIGIYGGSAGGQTAMRALIDHHDFYDVAVADCGCHDNRMDKIWWNEQWMGWPIDDSYRENSNAADAHRVQGELLLIVGELDKNVDPASTMQVVGALQRANKSFEFIPIVGTGHGAAETAYGNRRRMEFLAKHLLLSRP